MLIETISVAQQGCHYAVWCWNYRPCQAALEYQNDRFVPKKIAIECHSCNLIQSFVKYSCYLILAGGSPVTQPSLSPPLKMIEDTSDIPMINKFCFFSIENVKICNSG